MKLTAIVFREGYQDNARLPSIKAIGTLSENAQKGLAPESALQGAELFSVLGKD
jgi:hypothetical protein